jgi:serine/threonine protein kinase
MGVVLYMMLAGYLPYQHKNTHSLYKLILNARYEIPQNMSKLASDLIDSIFKTTPSKRIKLKDIKNHPWLKFHTSEIVQIPPILQNKIPLNDKVLQILDKNGYKIENVLE